MLTLQNILEGTGTRKSNGARKVAFIGKALPIAYRDAIAKSFDLDISCKETDIFRAMLTFCTENKEGLLEALQSVSE